MMQENTINKIEDVTIKKLDRLFVDWAGNLIEGKIKTKDGQPATVIVSTSQRWVQVLKQGNQNVIYPSLIIKRKFDIKPSDDRFHYKSFLNARELSRTINKDRSEKIKTIVYDIVKAKNPTFVDIGYDILLLSENVEDANMFHSLLYGKLQKNLGYVHNTKKINNVDIIDMYFDIIFQSPIDESNVQDFLKEQRKFFVGASFILKGWFLTDDDIKTVQSSPRNKIDFVEYTDNTFKFS